MPAIFSFSGVAKLFKNQRRNLLLIVPALYLLLGVLAIGETFRPIARRMEDGSSAQERDANRQREGSTLVDSVGVFKISGDRATFISDDGHARLVGLENLNLERVTTTIAESPDQLQWTVSGTITEYRGSNYLLISRAILKTKPEKAGARGKTTKTAGAGDKAT